MALEESSTKGRLCWCHTSQKTTVNEWMNLSAFIFHQFYDISTFPRFLIVNFISSSNDKSERKKNSRWSQRDVMKRIGYREREKKTTLLRIEYDVILFFSQHVCLLCYHIFFGNASPKCTVISIKLHGRH